MSEKTCKNCIEGQCTCKSKKDNNAFEDYIKDLCIKNEALEEENKSLKDGLSIMEKAYDNLNNKWDVVIGELRTLLHNV